MDKESHFKNFDSWAIVKKEIQNNSRREVLFKVAEVWWCAIGVNIGHEQDGKNNYFERPVLIYKKFNKNLFIGIPLTSNDKESDFVVSFKYLATESSSIKLGQAILSQTRPFSSKRLLRKMGKVEYEEFGKLRHLLRKVI